MFHKMLMHINREPPSFKMGRTWALAALSFNKREAMKTFISMRCQKNGLSGQFPFFSALFFLYTLMHFQTEQASFCHCVFCELHRPYKNNAPHYQHCLALNNISL